MHYSNLELIIIVLVSVVPAGFLTTYLIAVFNGHVVPDLPYISDTGTYPPESCIFAQILAFGAFLNLLVVFIRYYHVKLCLEKNLKPVNLHRLNYAAFITGIASTVGITLVGSFQESNVSTMHFIGAFFAFGGMTAYLWMQTFLSQSLPNIMFSTKRVFLVRIFLLTWSVVLGTLFAAFKKIAAGKFDGKDPYKWLPTDGGFVEHVISTASEWILFVLLMLTFLTFIHDFRRIVVSHPTIKDPLIIEIDSEPSESSPLIS